MLKLDRNLTDSLTEILKSTLKRKKELGNKFKKIKDISKVKKSNTEYCYTLFQTMLIVTAISALQKPQLNKVSLLSHRNHLKLIYYAYFQLISYFCYSFTIFCM